MPVVGTAVESSIEGSVEGVVDSAASDSGSISVRSSNVHSKNVLAKSTSEGGKSAEEKKSAFEDRGLNMKSALSILPAKQLGYSKCTER